MVQTPVFSKAAMATEVYNNPKKCTSKVWKHFGFYKVNKDGLATLDNLNMKVTVCKLCGREYSYFGK